MQCPESLRVQAYFDGEVDAVTASQIERHAEHCGECRAQLHDLDALRSAIRQHLPLPEAPASLRTRIKRTLDRETGAALTAARGLRMRSRQFWWGALSGLGVSAVAAVIALMLLLTPPSNALLDQLLVAHVRSLMPAHLIDVVSSDRHTVKPWFAGHADVSPAVADFAAKGYRLVGGRADYLDHQRSAVVVYQHGAHIINVFSWALGQDSLPRNTTRSGYHLMFWRVGDLAYCAVSDTGWDELSELVQLLNQQPG
jgi:anti-sigma factor RsiW